MSLRGHVNTKEHGGDNEDLAIINYTTRHLRYILIRKERSAAENKRPTGIFDHSLCNYMKGGKKMLIRHSKNIFVPKESFLVSHDVVQTASGA